MNGKDTISRRRFLDCSGRAIAGAAVACVAAQTHAGEAKATRSRYDSYCGLYCGACPNLLKSEGAKDPAKVKCLGCKSGKTVGWCSKCKIKQCAQEQGVAFCSECDMYPCEKLQAFHNNGRDYRLLASKNLDTIRDKGHGAWLKEQRKRWTCPTCGARFSWRDNTCPKCGKKVLSCEQEAAGLKKQQ